MKKIVLASSNAGKLKEFQTLFSTIDIEIIPQSEFKMTSAEETGFTFIENAILKARHACHHTKLPAIADDSGLEVDALNGEPGIYSARYAGENVSQTAHIEKLLFALKDIPQGKRSARFRCVLAYMRHEKDPFPMIATGTWEGEILEKPVGTGGFGYDPVFYLPELQCTAAELNAAHKNSISHRAIALKNLLCQMKP